MGHSFNLYTKFIEKLIFLTLVRNIVRVRIRGNKCQFFGRFLSTYQILLSHMKGITLDSLLPTLAIFTLGAQFKTFSTDLKTFQCFVVKKALSYNISWFCNIYTHLLILVSFNVHLVICLNLWVRACTSLICNIKFIFCSCITFMHSKQNNMEINNITNLLSGVLAISF